MAATGKQHRMRKTIHPIVIRDRIWVPARGFTSGHLHIIVNHTYNQ